MMHKKSLIFIAIALFASVSILTVMYAKGLILSENALNQPGFEYTNEPIQGLYTTEEALLDLEMAEGGTRRVILEKHYSDKKQYANMPVLTQNDFREKNTIFVIKYDFVLAEDIVIPDNCILDFEGGSLRGGTIIGNSTSIIPADYSIFNDCVIQNFNLPYIDPRWVGAIPDFNEKTNKGTDNSVYFQRAYDNIAVYHPGIDIFIVGKYLISKTVKFGMQCHLRGVHNNTRGLVMKNLHTETGSSGSLIAVGKCAAFQIVGDEKRDRTWADLSIEHIKFLGSDKQKSIAILYEASGSPTRPATIERCEASNLLYFLFSRAKENTTLGNLTIRENSIYNCTKAIYAVSDPNQFMGLTALKIENNVIEHNGDKCIHLNRCFGPIIIDNNILEGESNPIYLTSTYPTETNYVISNNYFEQPGNDDKKIHIDGVVSKESNGTENATFLTHVEIYGNTSPYGFAIELNGVLIRRLDRIDTPARWKTNYSTFTRCLFENIDVSDLHISQFQDWNFTTQYPMSRVKKNNVCVGESGSNLLSFDDSMGNAHTNEKTKVSVVVNEEIGKTNTLFITRIRPQFTEKYKKVVLRLNYNNKDVIFGASLPREIPYYAFIIIKKDEGIRKISHSYAFSAYNEGADLEMSNITVYQSVLGQLYNYPHIIIPYSMK